METVNYQSIIEKIKERREEEKKTDLIISLISEELKEFNGKKITKRIRTKLGDKFPKLNFCYFKAPWTFNLCVWGGHIHYTDRMILYLGKVGGAELFNYEYFLSRSKCYFYNKEENDLIDKDCEELEDKIKRYNEAVKVINETSKFNSSTVNYSVNSHENCI